MKTTQSFDYDALIIGSGFGGSITAEQLTPHLKVGLLERGPWRDTLPTRSMGIENCSPLPQNKYFYSHFLRSVDVQFNTRLKAPEFTLNKNGLYEVFYDQRLLLVNASSVGGGSHAYTALHHPPNASDYWHKISDEIDPNAMAQHQQRFLQAMGSEKIPDHVKIPNHTRDLYHKQSPIVVNEKTWQPHMGLLFSNASKSDSSRQVSNTGSECERKASNHENEGLLGSFTGSKTTLDIAYLFSAMQAGLKIHDCTEAWIIAKNPAGANRRYRVDCYNHRKKTYQSFTTDHLFLAAGTLNTLKLLFRSRDQAKTLSGLDFLGEHFATNADSVSLWMKGKAGEDYTQGMPCHGPLSFNHGDQHAQFIQAGVSGLYSIPLPKALKKRLAQSLFIIAMAEDANTGRARWHRNRLSIKYSIHEQAIYQHIHARFQEIKDHFQRPLFFSRSLATTVHPLGGAPISDLRSTGLINGRGEVHDYPGLYISDATALPKAPGTPPSMSIAAWSYHVAAQFLEKNAIATRYVEQESPTTKSPQMETAL